MLPVHFRLLGLVIAISLSIHLSSRLLPILGIAITPVAELLAILLLLPISRVLMGLVSFCIAALFAQVYGRGALIVLLMMLFPKSNGVVK